MVTRTLARGSRPAAVSASTVFAIALAIVAGLIFAWLFKMVLLDKKPVKQPVDPTVPLTVAAGNLYDKTEVRPNNVKTIRVSPEMYEAYRRRGTMLRGTQPVGRVTKKPIMAEEPFFAEEMEEFHYPDSVAKRVPRGMRAVIVTVPAKEAMVQVDDFVDVYCTLSNDAFGPGSSGTAEIAAGSRVVARFGTTRPGAQPRNMDAPREYTLAVTPYRFAMIELAKTLGAKFSLSVVSSQANGEEASESVTVRQNDPNDPREQSADLVNGADLAALFRIGPPAPAGPPPFRVEKYVGISPAGSQQFDYVPPSRTPPTGGSASGAP